VSPCSTPLPLATLVDYWLDELPAPSEVAAEEHLIACTDCTRWAEELARLGAAVRSLIRRGGVSLGLTPSLLARLEQDGVRIRRHRVEPGEQTRCTAGRPAKTGPTCATAIRPRRTARPSTCSGNAMAPGQSSAAQIISIGMLPSAKASGRVNLDRAT
jgi:hypothetical protein